VETWRIFDSKDYLTGVMDIMNYKFKRINYDSSRQFWSTQRLQIREGLKIGATPVMENHINAFSLV